VSAQDFYGAFYNPSFDGNNRAKKFVRRDTMKRWACPTKKEALESFLQRKRRSVEILTAQINKEKMLVAEAWRMCNKEMGYPVETPEYPAILRSGTLL
jgi:hypothetical protein